MALANLKSPEGSLQRLAELEAGFSVAFVSGPSVSHMQSEHSSSASALR